MPDTEINNVFEKGFVIMGSQPTKKLRSKSKRAQKKYNTLILDHRDNGRKLARSFLRRWRVRMNLEEVDSIVDLALCEAAERFDEKKGAAFMTFFFYHLRGHMVRAVERATNSSNMMVNFSQTSDIDVTEWAQQGNSSSGSTLPVAVTHFEEANANPEKLILRKENIEQCRVVCEELDTLEQEVLGRSFSKEEALVDIAKSLGYSRCHISRVKKRALEQLKVLLENKDMAPEGAKKEVTTVTTLNTRIEVKSARKRRARRSTRTRVAARSEVKAA